MYHVPALLEQSVNGLNINPEGIYVDVTFGGGGHSREILKYLTTGKLFAFDQDEDARSNAEAIKSTAFTFIEANFRFLKRFLKMHGVKEVDGILADLGVSSHQINTPGRGFSTRFEGKLDMRMDKAMETTAGKILNTYSARELHKILGMYGEVRNAKSLALAVVQARINKKMETTGDLKEVLKAFAPRGKEFKYFAQVFQALRIEVNEELKALEEFLQQAAEILKPEGRLVVLAYHSLEDRLVKNFINKGQFIGEPEKDVYGNVYKPLEAITKKPIEADAIEIESNPRARSAKLRVAKKTI